MSEQLEVPIEKIKPGRFKRLGLDAGKLTLSAIGILRPKPTMKAGAFRGRGSETLAHWRAQQLKEKIVIEELTEGIS